MKDFQVAFRWATKLSKELPKIICHYCTHRFSKISSAEQLFIFHSKTQANNIFRISFIPFSRQTWKKKAGRVTLKIRISSIKRTGGLFQPTKFKFATFCSLPTQICSIYHWGVSPTIPTPLSTLTSLVLAFYVALCASILDCLSVSLFITQSGCIIGCLLIKVWPDCGVTDLSVQIF